MCGRIALTTSAQDLRDGLGLDATPSIQPHYNVPPSRPVAVVRVSGGARRTLEWLQWGLIPHWARDPKTARSLALARVEGVAASKVFGEAVRKRRCLVVVDGFYEWRRERKGMSQPFFIRAADKAPLTLAGIWDRSIGRDGEVVESCAIVTQPSRPPADAIHDRMPLALERDAWERWLDPTVTEIDAVTSMLAPRAPRLIVQAVSPHVNDPRHDDARCLEPWQPGQGELFS